MGSQKSTLHRFLRQTKASRRALWIKPSLTPQQKLQSLQFVVNQVQPMGRSFVLDPYINWVHIDEKWLYIQIDGRRVWLLQNESKKEFLLLRIKGLYPRLCFLLWWAVLIGD